MRSRFTEEVILLKWLLGSNILNGKLLVLKVISAYEECLSKGPEFSVIQLTTVCIV